MANAEDEVRLREIWSPENLGDYEGHWIAFRNGEVLHNDPSLDRVSESFLGDIREGNGPLFAYVTFLARA